MSPSPKSLFEKDTRPLADRLRPQKLEEVVGQEHLTEPGKLLHTLVKKKQPVSMILWGPPGSGKTTLARILASEWDVEYAELSAVTSGLADVKKVIEAAKSQQGMGQTTLLFVDEIHRFNRAQQDAFLPHVENGTIVLIGATTENPSFEVITPLLSRSRVVVLQPLQDVELVKLIERAVKSLKGVTLDKKAKQLLAHLAAGDARVALMGVETAAKMTPKITSDVVKQAMQRQNLSYDKHQEDHYNTISAFIKSMRGSQTDAALYYLHRMLAGGEDPKFIARRIVIFASEDIGMASPHALTLAVSAFQAVERIGLPEGEYALTQATIAMCKATKSRAVADAMGKAKRAVQEYPNARVPLHLRNAPTKLMKGLGYGKDYEWQADFQHEAGFLPDELKDAKFYKD